MSDLPRFANLRTGGNLPARPGLIRTVIGGVIFVLCAWPILVLAMLL